MKSNAIWGILSMLVAVGLFILGLYLGAKNMEPVYAIKKDPSLIFDKSNASPLIKIINSKDSSVLKDNIYVTTVVIWNNGQVAISPEDVRKNLRFSFPDKGTQIIDHKIVSVTHPGVSNFLVNLVNNELLLDWDYFDPGFGLELQVTYASSKESEIMGNGHVLGAGLKKVKIQPERGIKSFFHSLSPLIIALLIIITLVILTGSLLISRKMEIVALISFLALLGILVFIMVDTWINIYNLP